MITRISGSYNGIMNSHDGAIDEHNRSSNCIRKSSPFNCGFLCTEILIGKEQPLQGNPINAQPSEKNLYHGEGNSYRTPDVC